MYVDDLIVMGTWVQDISAFKFEMVAQFKMSDLSVLSYYLGIEVKQGKDSITLGQRTYAARVWRHGRLQAICNSNGEEDQALEAEHNGKGGRDTLLKYRRRAAVAHSHPTGQCIRGQVRESLLGGSSGGPLDGSEAAAMLHQGHA